MSHIFVQRRRNTEKYGIICVMKRIVIFKLVNLAGLVMLSISCEVLFALFGVQAQEVFGEYANVAVFALVLRFGGAVISLLLSKPMAKWTTGAKTITGRLTYSKPASTNRLSAL